MTDDQVRAKAMELWPAVNEWAADAGRPYTPATGSALAEDDKLTQQLMASHTFHVSASSWALITCLPCWATRSTSAQVCSRCRPSYARR